MMSSGWYYPKWTPPPRKSFTKRSKEEEDEYYQNRFRWTIYDEEQTPNSTSKQQQQDGEADTPVELSSDEESFLSAARSGRLLQVQSFLKNGSGGLSRINVRNEFGETALILACRHQRNNIIQYLLNTQKVPSGKLNIHVRDQHGKNALSYAAENGLKEATYCLASRGGEMDATYELSAFSISCGLTASEMHSCMYAGHVRYCIFQDLKDAKDAQLIPDLITIVLEYLE